MVNVVLYHACNVISAVLQAKGLAS